MCPVIAVWICFCDLLSGCFICGLMWLGRSERDTFFLFPWMGEVEAFGQRGCPQTLSHMQAGASFWVLSSWWWYLTSSLSFIQSSPPLLCWDEVSSVPIPPWKWYLPSFILLSPLFFCVLLSERAHYFGTASIYALQRPKAPCKWRLALQ